MAGKRSSIGNTKIGIIPVEEARVRYRTVRNLIAQFSRQVLKSDLSSLCARPTLGKTTKRGAVLEGSRYGRFAARRPSRKSANI
jgi:hypothetical protein